eukprot:3061641-Pyramimonas_sp.AAC.1
MPPDKDRITHDFRTIKFCFMKAEKRCSLRAPKWDRNIEYIISATCCGDAYFTPSPSGPIE